MCLCCCCWQSVTDGYNGTILAYGQTGSGKTHTLLGPPGQGASVPAPTPAPAPSIAFGAAAAAPDLAVSVGSFGPSSKGFGVRPLSRAGPILATPVVAPTLPPVHEYADDDDPPPVVLTRSEDAAGARGIIPRAVEHIFDTIRSDTKAAYTVSVSYVQIYCELVHDLLSEEGVGRSLAIREDGEGSVYVEGVTKVRVANEEEGLRLLAQGHANRAVARTKYAPSEGGLLCRGVSWWSVCVGVWVCVCVCVRDVRARVHAHVAYCLCAFLTSPPPPPPAPRTD